MHIAGFQIAGSNAPPFPIAANDPATLQAGGSKPGAFLSLLSDAGEYPVEASALPAAGSIPGSSIQPGYPKERPRYKSGEIAPPTLPAIPEPAHRTVLLEPTPGGNADTILPTTAFQFLAPTATGDFALLASPSGARNGPEESGQKFPGLPAHLGLPAQLDALSESTGNRAKVMFDSGFAPRTEIPLAFAMQLTANSSQPSLPEQIRAAAVGNLAGDIPPGADRDSSPAQLPLASGATTDVAAIAVAVDPAPASPVFMVPTGATSPPSANNLVGEAGGPTVAAQQTNLDAVPPAREFVKTPDEALGDVPDPKAAGGVGVSNTLGADWPKGQPDPMTNPRPVAPPNVRASVPVPSTWSSSSSSTTRFRWPEDSIPGGAAAPISTRRNGSQSEPVPEPPEQDAAAEKAAEADAPNGESVAKSVPGLKTKAEVQGEAATKDQPSTAAQPSAKAPAPVKDAREHAGDTGNSNSRSDPQGEMARAAEGPLPLTAESFTTREAAREPGRTPLPSGESLPEIAALSTARLSPAREISLRLEGAGVPNVSVQLTERAGKIDVAVRSGDEQLNRSLQSGLGDLVSQLESHGFKTDAWTPGAARGAALVHSSSDTTPNQQQSGHSGPGNSKQEQHSDSGSRRQRRTDAPFDKTLAEEDARTE